MSMVVPAYKYNYVDVSYTHSNKYNTWTYRSVGIIQITCNIPDLHMYIGRAKSYTINAGVVCCAYIVNLKLMC